ncbi:MAG: hypothetical protein PHW73_06090 [Atribacterota bacterium]|nr:hypothetical protein [Atribacterota bacterium]
MKSKEMTVPEMEKMIRQLTRVVKKVGLPIYVRYFPGFAESFRKSIREKTGNDRLGELFVLIAKKLGNSHRTTQLKG